MELKEVWMIDYARTAFSRSRPRQPERDVFGEIRGDELLATLLMKFFDGKLADKGITKEDVDELTVGTAMGVGEQWTYGGRTAAFLADFPFRTSSVFFDKQCGSAGAGMHMGIMEIMTGFSKCVLSTGVEHMTRVSMLNEFIRPNEKMINKKSEWYRPRQDFITTSNMIQTAQKLYEQEIPAFTKEDLDKLGVRSHNLTVENQETGWFKGEIIPIEGHVEGNVEEPMIVDRDMAARKSTLESVAGLRRLSKPFFLEKNGGRAGYKEREGTGEGVITAGNSSPLNAGATACILMEAEEAKSRGLDPMARIVSIG
jgi:acetyl-CoA C-acetyltransferase